MGKSTFWFSGRFTDRDAILNECNLQITYNWFYLLIRSLLRKLEPDPALDPHFRVLGNSDIKSVCKSSPSLLESVEESIEFTRIIIQTKRSVHISCECSVHIMCEWRRPVPTISSVRTTQSSQHILKWWCKKNWFELSSLWSTKRAVNCVCCLVLD